VNLVGKDEKVINVRLNTEQKKQLEAMSAELSIGQATLAKMSVLSLLANYEKNGLQVWFDLIHDK